MTRKTETASRAKREKARRAPRPEAEAEADEFASRSEPLFPFAEEACVDIDADADANAGAGGQRRLFDGSLSAETDGAIEKARDPSYDDIRMRVLERDGWKCTYPGCQLRARLHVHHIRYRSRGGGHQLWNLTVVCELHHGLLHRQQIHVRGRAPLELEWTPPRLMREVLERRRNRPSLWHGELEAQEWSLEPDRSHESDRRRAV